METQNSCFCVWLFSLSVMFWDLTKGVYVSVLCSFLSPSTVPLYKYPTVCPFSSWQHRFPDLAITNKIIMNLSDHGFFCKNMFLLFLEKYLGLKLLGHRVEVYVKLSKNLFNVLCTNVSIFITHSLFPSKYIRLHIYKKQKHYPGHL